MLEQRFDICKPDNLDTESKKLWGRLIMLIKDGEIFPAFRKDEIHFYHAGGYHNEHKFIELTGVGFVESIDRFMKENYNRFGGEKSLERQVLDTFCSKTFTTAND